jgi:ferrochelatase
MSSISSNHSPIATAKRPGILMVNMGGPDSLDGVKPFLLNLFSDPDIFKLPLSFLTQKLLANVIVNSRLEEVKHNYAKMGGRSPQFQQSMAQVKAVEQALLNYGHDVPVVLAMRYWHPFTEEAVSQLLAQGVDHIIVLPLYPHYSTTTTGSNVNALKRALAKRNATDLPVSVINDYHQHPGYLQAVAETIHDCLGARIWGCPRDQVRVLFSAHSLPKKFVKRRNDPYPAQIEACISTLMATHFPDTAWDLAFQSKVGKMPWLGPSTDGVIQYYAALGWDNILVVPISFVCEHIETLVEIDIDYIGLAHELGIQHIYRANTVGTRPTFIQALVSMVLPYLQSEFTGLPTAQAMPDLALAGRTALKSHSHAH